MDHHHNFDRDNRDRREEERQFAHIGLFNNTGFRSLDVDLYSLLNVSRHATITQIQKQFRTISRLLHPDKRGHQEIFIQVQRAYAYLSNSVTRLIYDQFGIPGIIMFEKEKESFEALVDELREIENLTDAERDETQMARRKREVEYQILKKTKAALQTQVITHASAVHQKTSTVELAVEAKDFFNTWHDFYKFDGNLFRAARLIRLKYFATSLSFALPINKDHRLHFTIKSSTDLRQNLGQPTFSVTHHCDVSDSLRIDTGCEFKDNQRVLSVSVEKELKEKGLVVSASMAATADEGPGLPSISVRYHQLKPYVLSMGGGFGLLNFGFEKQMAEASPGSVAYEAEVSLNPETVSINPRVSWLLQKNVLLTSAGSFDLKGTMVPTMSLLYTLKGGQRLSLSLTGNFKNFGHDIDMTYVNIAYIHQNFVFKVPVFCFNQSQSTPAIALTSAFYVATNALAYLFMKHRQASAAEAKDKKDEIKFGRYQQLAEQARLYMGKPSFELKYSRSLNSGNQNCGLVIKRAYIGLADHIYLLDSGVLVYSEPQSVDQYMKCQLFEVTKQLQAQVEHGKLRLSKYLLERTEEEEGAHKEDMYSDLFPEMKAGVFNPLANKKQKALLWVEFKFRHVFAVYVFDFKSEVTLPDQIM